MSIGILAIGIGCRGTRKQAFDTHPPAALELPASGSKPGLLTPVAFEDAPPARNRPATGPIALADVVQSVQVHFPLLNAARFSRDVASGQQLAASGAFDLALSGAAEHGPTGFYQTHRHRFGIEQPLMKGGSVFAGYRVGRGSFEPWYLERQTNGGGEFSVGVILPLARNRQIDQRRANLMRTGINRERVEPEIRQRLIEYILEASIAYWDWVEAGRQLRVAEAVLKLASDRQDGLKKRLEKGDIAKIELTDNERLIVSRSAKVIEAKRKLREAAVKLSLYYRDTNGTPVIPSDSRLPKQFPKPKPIDESQYAHDLTTAIENRPELLQLAFEQKALELDRREAGNLLLPSIDAVLSGSQDLGEPTSSKRDKSRFEVQAGVFVEVPLQRRRARGRLAQVDARMSQLVQHQTYLRDTISTQVRAAMVAIAAAIKRITQSRRAYELAKTLEEAERKKYVAGQSNLLNVNLREMQTAAAAADLVESFAQYFRARAAYRWAKGEGKNRIEQSPSP